MPSIFLIGFMASGKSAVAQALARRLAMPCLDLDSLIEGEAGSTISAIFESEGEAGFRQRESQALGQVCRGAASVVATGGGVVCLEHNLQEMKGAGIVVHLATELSTALSRAGNTSTRPLLEQSPSHIEDRYRARAPIYRRAHLSVSTEGKTIEMVAADVEMALACAKGLATPGDFPGVVALQERSYPILVRKGCLAELGAALRVTLPGLTTVGLVSDDNVSSLYGETVIESLKAAGIEVVSACVRPGERSKDAKVFIELCEELIEQGLDRSSAIVALGGGVVGDLAGFVAASLFRGIPVVQVPTSLLAMIDSAIGGKTGINSKHGKNLLGAFWQPRLVWADPTTLATLPPRESRAGFGELVKYALLDGALWPAVETQAPALAQEELETSAGLTALVRACADMKAAIVSADERESGLRATLNLGHTIGHAIEVSAGYGALLHGEAVALGLLAACRVSHKLGLCDAGLVTRVRSVLNKAGLDTDLSPWLTAEVLEHMRVDKKRTGSRVRFIAIVEPGDVRLQDLELGQLTAMLLAN